MMMPRNYEETLARKREEEKRAAEKRAEQNRANAAHSTGPVTEAGRQAVSANAVTHGLTGAAHAILPGEESAFEKSLNGYLKHYAPVGQPEIDIVRNLAENNFRLSRAHRLEQALFEQVLLAEVSQGLDPDVAQAQALIDPKTGLQRMALYANRIERAIEKTEARLKEMQAERKAAYAQAEQEAIELTQLAQLKNNAFDPAGHFKDPDAQGGFVFSRPAIDAKIQRAQRLEEARALVESVAQASRSAQVTKNGALI
jgi:hypothetical protein